VVKKPETRFDIFERSLTLEGTSGRYSLDVDEVWEGQPGNIFGGFLLGVLVRTAGLETSAAKPVSMTCQYLRPTRLGETLDISAVSMRRGRNNELLRVSIGQAGKPTVEALVRTADAESGPECTPANQPELDDPLSWPLAVDVFRQLGMAPPPLFVSAVDAHLRGPDRRVPGIDADSWWRLASRATYDDPFMEAARMLLGMDGQGMAVLRRLDRVGPAGEALDWGFSNLDSLIHFHQTAGSEWLYVLSRVMTGRDGFASVQTQTWSPEGDLLATVMSQIAFFPLREGWSFQK
jgi:acyl-CoA thioesterase